MDIIDFFKIIENMPTIDEFDELCKSDLNLSYLNNFEDYGYLNLLTPLQKYHLFTTACGYESVNIALLLCKNNIDNNALKEFMINFLSEVGGSNEFIIFKYIFEKKEINFSFDELNKCFYNIIKTCNLDFIEWFYSLNLINLNNDDTKKMISEVLKDAHYYEDFIVAKYLCNLYIKLKTQ